MNWWNTEYFEDRATMLCDNVMVGKRHFARVKNPQNDTIERVDPEYKVWALVNHNVLFHNL